MVAEKQQAVYRHSLVAETDSQSCLHTQEEELLEHRDEDVEGEAALTQCWCLAEIEPIEGWATQLG